jgi:hypothetical protein
MKRLTTLALLAGMLSAPRCIARKRPLTHCRSLTFRYPGRKPAAHRRLPGEFARHDGARAGKRPQPASLPAMPPPVAAGIPDTVPLTPIVGGRPEPHADGHAGRHHP